MVAERLLDDGDLADVDAADEQVVDAAPRPAAGGGEAEAVTARC